MPDTLSHIRGALLGVHAGDSLGATLEFMSRGDVLARGVPHRDITGGGPFRWAPGAATDDTDLTWALTRVYLNEAAALRGEADIRVALSAEDHFRLLVRVAAENMLEWLNDDPRDVGNATRVGLHRFKHTGDPFASGAGSAAAGNGSLMRCIATGLARTDHGQRHRESRAFSAITHDATDCQDACEIYNDMVAALVAGGSPTDAVAAAQATAVRFVDDSSARHTANFTDAIHYGSSPHLLAAAAASREPTFGPGWQGGEGWVCDSLRLAVAALSSGLPFEDALVAVVNLGGDSDTNGAIAGGLLGAYYGVEAIPERWLSKLQLHDYLWNAAEGLLTVRESR
jgi:ADP-ribosylglycohydrolase